ncbi:MAG: methylthioribulose 1-phosphate dehydratase [Candidatus Melainabacteria bacterium]
MSLLTETPPSSLLTGEADLRDALSRVIRFLHAQGWTPATSSNFSARIPGGFLVSASGLDKADWQPEQFLHVNHEGHPVDPGEARRPSAETLLHATVYDIRPDVGAVLHTHSVNATVLSRRYAQAGLITLTGFEILKGLSGIHTHEAMVSLPVYPNSQEMTVLADRLRVDLHAGQATHGFLIAGHGLYAWGATLADAKRHVEVFEFVMACLIQEAAMPPVQPEWPVSGGCLS